MPVNFQTYTVTLAEVDYIVLSELNIKYNCKIPTEYLHAVVGRAQELLPSTTHLNIKNENFK